MHTFPHDFYLYFTPGGKVSPDIPDNILEELVWADIGDREDGDGPLCDFSAVRDRFIPIRDRCLAKCNLDKAALGYTD